MFRHDDKSPASTLTTKARSVIPESLRLKSGLMMQSPPTRTESFSPRRRTLHSQRRFLTAEVTR
ncbi:MULTISPECIES: hypothetical protein [unclassified Chamaesiphon]|uniref:hypothetical protein n=1 Tax=unclassified Chamaesiphon TaxID=2620921 RepID=UPI00286D299D|nr:MULTISPECIES: hypothetical protein [unclassified Chamaesiphon]